MAVIMHHHQPPTHVRSCRVASLRGEKRESSKVVCPLLALFFLPQVYERHAPWPQARLFPENLGGAVDVLHIEEFVRSARTHPGSPARDSALLTSHPRRRTWP